MRSFVTIFGGMLVAFQLVVLLVPLNAAPVAFAAPLLALTETAEPPTNTPVPPTNTPVPPTDTPVPPADTAVVAVDTPVPPTDTPAPTSKPERERKPSATAVPTDAVVVAFTAEPTLTLQPTEVPSVVPAVPTSVDVAVAAVQPVARPRRLPVTGAGGGFPWLLVLGGGLLMAGLLLRRKPGV